MNHNFIFIFIINIFHIYSIKFNTHKNSLNNFFILLTENNPLLLNKNNQNIDNYGHIPVLSSKEGLYTLNLNIGTPRQQFNLILDTCSPLLWINDNNCFGCKSKNNFISKQSNSFYSSNDKISINYLSGEISGNICKDTIEFNFNNSIIKDFNFLLVNKTNIDFDIHGIFGLSKGVDNIINLEYSTINQIYKNGIIKNNIFLLDFSKNSFYIGEIPQYLNKYNNFTCKGINGNKFDNYYWNCNFDKLQFNNNNKIISSKSKDKNNIIFNSGTNCLIFPLNYLIIFEDIISENKLLNKSMCYIKSNNINNNIYSLICNDINSLIDGKNKEYQNIYNNEEFITFYLNNDNNENKIYLKLNDLYNKNESNFNIYFAPTPNNAIILGIPFFEKYTILLNKDNNEVIIYEENNNIIKDNSIFLKIFIGIFIAIIIILILLIIYRIIRKTQKSVSSSQIEKQFSDFGFFQPEIP